MSEVSSRYRYLTIETILATECGAEVGKFMSRIRLHVYGSGAVGAAGKAERKGERTRGKQREKEKRTCGCEAKLSRDDMKRFSSWSRRWRYQKLKCHERKGIVNIEWYGII